MIQLQTTQAGLAAIASNQVLHFTRFVAGSGQDEQNAAIQTPEQEISIARTATYIAGQTYTVNGAEQVVDYNSIKLVGVLDTSLASEPYQWSELALMARVGSDDQETTIAYGKAVQGSYAVTPSVLNTYVINFELIFSDAPEITVETTQTGVTWADFLQHENAAVTAGIHGLRYADGTLYINNQPMSVAQTGELLAIAGIDSIVSVWPEPNLAWLGKIALNRVGMNLKRLVKSENLHEGQFIYLDGDAWALGNGTEEDSLLIVADDVTPSSGEITLSEAQAHFLAWQPVGSLSERLQALEDATLQNGALSFGSLDNAEYNSEWVSRMTGGGTEASPFLIYTPYDFNQIRSHTAAVYRLMNNLDFTAIIGLAFSVEGGILTRGEADTAAPLYNSGAGFAPFSSFSGVLDGNGKVVKGLTACGDSVQGMINTLNGGKIQSLTLKDGYIVNTKNTATAVYEGSFVGQTAGTAYILNCVNLNTVLTTATNSSTRVHLGGILGYADCEGAGYNLVMRGCANHGRLYNDNLNSGGSLCGLIGNENLNSTSSQLIVSNCYNTADLTGVNVAGLMYRFASVNSSNNKYHITGCYNAGALTGSASCDSLIPASVASISESFDDCYARSGYANLNTAVGLPLDEMQTADFADLLNGDSDEAVYIADDINGNNGLPMLSFEYNSGAGIPGDLPLALLDASSGKIYSSKFSYNMFRDYGRPAIREIKEQIAELATKNELSELEGELDTLATKQETTTIQSLIPALMNVTLEAANWEEANGLISQTLQRVGVTSNTTVMLIPKSADSFTYSLTPSILSEDTIKITASSLPASDINIGLLVAG